jgi:hypothetical protein
MTIVDYRRWQIALIAISEGWTFWALPPGPDEEPIEGPDAHSTKPQAIAAAWDFVDNRIRRGAEFALMESLLESRVISIAQYWAALVPNSGR